MTSLVRLSNATTEVVVDTSTGAPAVVHWGRPLGDAADPAASLAALDRPLVLGMADEIAPLTTVPEHAAGFPGRPGLLGRRGGGRSWAPRFATTEVTTDGTSSVVVDSADPEAGLALSVEIRLGDVLSIEAAVTNTAARRYSLDALTVSVPLPEHLDELAVIEGRWARELQVVRRPWPSGTHLVENRRGRTSWEQPPLVFAGRQGFGEWHGEVVGAHVAWSGNHQLLVERTADGRRYVQGGELLHPGEIVLEPGETHRTPRLLLTRSDDGLTAATWGFHRSIRSSPARPTRPRPVLVNTWEAVYFDHDHERLRELATRAARIGAERFVLDDGWFGSRRDDRRALGEWWVSPEVYPDGLAPLIDHVTSLGLEFGIWVEPEMVNPDSELYRAHPDWTLAAPGADPVLSRHQLVLDLARPEAFDHVHRALDSLLADHDISFVKWDMNREHIAASGADGAAGTHAQTRAVYRLLDQLRAAHPTVEFESCSGGGGRIDHEILRRAERVWTSDCNDALERQDIQRGASLLIPPELMGAHIGPARSHTTGRVHALGFRAITAMFGHLGIEWDLTALDERELADLAEVVALHQRHRPLLHTGDVVRFDTEPWCRAHGVYATDRSEALVSFAQLTTAPSLTALPLRLPGLDPDATYRVEHLPVPRSWGGTTHTQPAWFVDGVDLTGAQLAAHGLRPPTLHPESAVLIHLTRR